MLVAETCLLLSIRDALRTALSLSEEHCNIELDDQIPAIAGDVQVAICSAGTTPGERHGSSGGVWDFRFAVRVTVYKRTAEVARDRRRDIFIERLTGLNSIVDKIIRTVDFDYTTILDGAHAYLVGTEAEGGNYPEPFRSFAIDPNVRPVYRDPYDAVDSKVPMGDPLLSLARGVTFQRARFMKERG